MLLFSSSIVVSTFRTYCLDPKISDVDNTIVLVPKIMLTQIN